ncbi:MAG: hypothetical protein IPK67_14330 [Planctomycetes bacterium]|nr:hypothetical protein [Planctomycetota bacterium]
MGLPIGAPQPREIAVSVVAELTLVRRGAPAHWHPWPPP